MWLELLLAGLIAGTTTAADGKRPWIQTTERLTLLSANDGQNHLKFNDAHLWTDAPMKLDRTNQTPDSITVVHLSRNQPPVVKTVYGTVANTIAGAPYLAMSADGRYGFVPCSNGGVFTPEAGNILSVIDLEADKPRVVQTLKVGSPMMVLSHPNNRHFIVAAAHSLPVYEMKEGQLILKQENRLNMTVDSMAISPDGKTILAALQRAPETHDITGLHLFSYDDGVIQYRYEVAVKPELPPLKEPFAMRFTPDGKRALVPNGGGMGNKGRLDDILIVDMTRDPVVATEVIPQVADGIESLAVHPSGKFAVVACLEEFAAMSHYTQSHLAMIDLTKKPARLLYHLNVEAVPEGIEFSPDGSKLFVQSTFAHHIAVFDVKGFKLERSPFVIRVGHGPAAMGVVRSWKP